MTPEEALKLYKETGSLIWPDQFKSNVEWKPDVEVQPDPVRLTIEALLPILNVPVDRDRKKKWIKKAVEIVGLDKFVYDSAMLSETDRIKRNLWYNDVIEQVVIMSAYHRLEKHKIGKIQKDFERKRNALKAKFVAASINGTSNKNKFEVWHPNPDLNSTDYRLTIDPYDYKK